jgi:phenylacetic acid degradation operon negative regulatory protein
MRNAPLSARSVLASVLLGTDPPWLPTPLLVRTGALFGIAEGTVRTALSRMTTGGELVAERNGYRLAGHLVERQHRQDTSRRAEVREWDGTWELASVADDEARSASDRASLRLALGTLRLAELREGLWGRPDNLDPARSPDAARVVEQWCARWTGAVPSALPDLVQLWGLDGWAADARPLRRDMAALVDALEADDSTALAEGFVISAGVLRLFQHDPLLPSALLPPAWPGAELRREYDRFDRAYRGALRAWFRAGVDGAAVG